MIPPAAKRLLPGLKLFHGNPGVGLQINVHLPGYVPVLLADDFFTGALGGFGALLNRQDAHLVDFHNPIKLTTARGIRDAAIKPRIILPRIFIRL